MLIAWVQSQWAIYGLYNKRETSAQQGTITPQEKVQCSCIVAFVVLDLGLVTEFLNSCISWLRKLQAGIWKEWIFTVGMYNNQLCHLYTELHTLDFWGSFWYTASLFARKVLHVKWIIYHYLKQGDHWYVCIASSCTFSGKQQLWKQIIGSFVGGVWIHLSLNV